ncbi:MAG: PAS domain-containing methyl-accepting chemotaxis protein [Marinomonas sp.]
MLVSKKKYLHDVAQLHEHIDILEQTENSLKQEMLFYALDQQGVIVDVNELFVESIGFTKHELIGMRLKDLVAEKSLNKDHCRQMFENLNAKVHWHGAVQLVNKAGTENWYRSIIQMSPRPNGAIGFDVFSSELTRTITKSRETEDMITALNRSNAVIEFSLDGMILNANDNFLHAMGYSKSQIIGKHHRIFCSDEEANSAAYREFWDTLRSGVYVSERFKRVRRDGSDIWLEASYNPVFDDTGELYKVIKFATNITEQMNRELATVETSKFAYDTSLKTDSAAKRGIEVIQTTTATMGQLSEQMAKATVGITELSEQSLKVAELVSNVRGIADQTNLLALNAAIEAARAGEQGRGFAVVADEVRQLASRTTVATGDIIKVVEDNKLLTQNAVKLIEESMAKVQVANELSEEAGAVMNDIHLGARQVLEAISQLNSRL